MAWYAQSFQYYELLMGAKNLVLLPTQLLLTLQHFPPCIFVCQHSLHHHGLGEREERGPTTFAACSELFWSGCDNSVERNLSAETVVEFICFIEKLYLISWVLVIKAFLCSIIKFSVCVLKLSLQLGWL